MSAAVQFEVPAIVPADPNANIADLLVNRVRATPSLALFAVPDGAGWRDITAAEFQRQVIELAKGFVAAGIEPGDKVAFIARTTYEWSLVDFALFFAGAVMVPVYETSSADSSWPSPPCSWWASTPWSSRRASARPCGPRPRTRP